jgi:hypothetical protein
MNSDSHTNRALLAALALVIPLFVVGCSSDPRSMTYGHYRHLSDEERMQVGEKLSASELEDLVTVIARGTNDSAIFDRRTLRELIAEGKEIRSGFEPVSPTK